MKNLILFSALLILLPSCATIIGGEKYFAKVEVSGHPTAKIEYNGAHVGTGIANFKVPRREANKLSFTISKEGCENQIVKFTSRSLRGWALASSIVFFTGLTVNGGWVPIPFGIIVDGIFGSLWKPDVTERGVRKLNMNNYSYSIEYLGCPTNYEKKPELENAKKESPITGSDKLRELKKLLEEGLITKEEYEKTKANILEEF